jgi:NAD+ kinase
VTDQRRVLLLAHPGREQAHDVASELVEALSRHQIEVRLLADEAEALGLGGNPHVTLAGSGDPSADWELVVVIGGDGTILRAAEVAHESGTPILFFNLVNV